MSFHGHSEKHWKRMAKRGTKREPMPKSLRPYAGKLDVEWDREPMPDVAPPIPLYHQAWGSVPQTYAGKQVKKLPNLDWLERRAILNARAKADQERKYRRRDYQE